MGISRQESGALNAGAKFRFGVASSHDHPGLPDTRRSIVPSVDGFRGADHPGATHGTSKRRTVISDFPVSTSLRYDFKHPNNYFFSCFDVSMMAFSAGISFRSGAELLNVRM